jgi:hypothetical protein
VVSPVSSINKTVRHDITEIVLKVALNTIKQTNKNNQLHLELIDKNTPGDDPKLVEMIRDYYIQQPSLEPYKLDFPNRLEFSNGQTPFQWLATGRWFLRFPQSIKPSATI